MNSYALLVLAIFATISEQQEPEDNVKLLTKNDGIYRASFTYTIEDFLQLSYIEKNEFFRSSKFSTKSQSQVQWFFEIEPAVSLDNEDERVILKLIASALPKNVVRVLGSAECGILDSKDTKQHVQKSGNELLGLGYYFKQFITRAELERNSRELLPDGHLTIQCDVDGLLKYNISLTNGVIPTVEVPKEDVKYGECSKVIATDTLTRLSLFDDGILGHVELKSSARSFKCHKAILSGRSLYFKTLLSEIGEKEDVSFDLSEDVSELELENMVQFNYRGRASNLKVTCRVLFPVSNKYKMDCLNAACLDVLTSQVNSKNAQVFLKYAQDVGSEKLMSAAAYCIYNPIAYNCRA